MKNKQVVAVFMVALLSILLWLADRGTAQQPNSKAFSNAGGLLEINQRGRVRIKSRSDLSTLLEGSTQFGTTGTPVTYVGRFSASLNFTALAGNTCETLTIPATGALSTDHTLPSLPNTLVDVDGATESTSFTVWVSAPNVISVRRCNDTITATADPAAATVAVGLMRF